MNEIVFLLEEISAREMLREIVPRILPAEAGIHVRYIVFEGKQDLEKQLAKKLRGYLNPRARFLVLRDQDSAECLALKQRLQAECASAGRPETVVRIACRELGAVYLGDLRAVGKAFGKETLAARQHQRKYRDPDSLGSPSRELAALTAGAYQKVSGSREIARLLDIEQCCSRSFRHLVRGIQRQAEALQTIAAG